MRNHILVLFFAFGVIGLITSCNTEKNKTIDVSKIGGTMQVENVLIINQIKEDDNSQTQIGYEDFFDANPNFIATKFQFPVGPPDGKGYYNAQKFSVNDHLGDDWNGVGGGNSDLGDPVYCIANGWVSEAKDFGGGWGNVVRVVHLLPQGDDYKYVESLYAHLDTILVVQGQKIMLGDQLGTLGNCDGAYLAHLHLEIRNDPEMPIGFGYSTETEGYLDPTKFINLRR